MSENELYPTETLGEDDDDGTMPENVAKLAQAVVGQRIVSVEHNVPVPGPRSFRSQYGARITLDSGRQVFLADTDDCCAYTQLDSFLLHPEKVDHMILGVGTTDGYETWHIFADAGDVLELSVGWSPGNPFYYGYGFEIQVVDPPSSVGSAS